MTGELGNERNIVMIKPSLTAEASLYETSGHYRTGRYTVHSSATMVSSIGPAVRVQEGEVCSINS